MINDILSLSQQLIAIKSTADNPEALDHVLETALTPLKAYSIEMFEHNGSRSVLIYNTKERPDKFKLLLNAHLDVVPGKPQQFKPEIKDGKLYGIGAMDMKASAATLILTFAALAKNISYPLGLQLVTDEEIGGFNGTNYQIEKGVRTEFVISGESTNLNVVNKAKGIVWLKITSLGKTAHGAYPWNGENAVWKMNSFLTKMQQQFPIPNKEQWVTTVNLSSIQSSNKTFNKIPDNCEISLDIRYIPEDSENIVDKIRALAPNDFTIEVITKEPGLYVDEKNPYIQLLQNSGKEIGRDMMLYSANGSSDARHFAKVQNTGIEFGPIGGDIGTDSEWVDISSLEIYHQLLKNYLVSLEKQ